MFLTRSLQSQLQTQEDLEEFLREHPENERRLNAGSYQDADEQWELWCRVRVVEKLQYQLTHMQREIVRKRYFDGVPMVRAAGWIGISTSNAYYHRRKILAHMMKRLEYMRRETAEAVEAAAAQERASNP